MVVESLLPVLLSAPVLWAVVAIVLHVAHYNISAQVEFRTRIYTKLLGRHAVYFYSVLLIVCALVRDHFVEKAIDYDPLRVSWLDPSLAWWVGNALFAFGILLNLWTLQAIGIKGMYNGDSFGWLMDAPVVDGPYKYFSDPQYVGTTAAAFGFAISKQSPVGVLLAILVGIVFWISVHFVEGPHLQRLYSNKKKHQLYPTSASAPQKKKQ